ncbi:MAG: hypothetical protein JJ879_10495 [Sneathiella sp.]|nr:hypothetical protein [Sneathiella sp.]
MINNTHAVTPAAYVSNSYSAPKIGSDTTQAFATEAVKDEVTLSPGAKILQKTLADLPPLILDPETNFQKAEQELGKLLDRYGIGAGTPVDVKLNDRGEFQVEGDHPLLGLIEDDLNSGRAGDLRNALIGGHTGLVLQRIGMAVEMAMNAADKNPSGTEGYYNWVKTVADEAKVSSLSFSYAKGGIDYQLVNRQNQIITADTGLSLAV